MNQADTQYLTLAQRIFDEGVVKKDRTGTGTRSIFGAQMRFDLREGFPLITTKKVHFKSVIVELLWFLTGGTNVKWLQERGCTIWDEWADEHGELGPVYGAQWRKWPGHSYADTQARHIADTPTMHLRLDGSHSSDWRVWTEPIDQIQNLLNDLRNNPDSRRLIVSAWNVADIPDMKLPPCHAFWQCNTVEMSVEERRDYAADVMGLQGVRLDRFNHASMDVVEVPRRYLDLQLYQRSCDVFLGVPFNIASYAALLMMLAQQVNMVPRHFVWTGGDVHIYSNHEEQMRLQLTRDPRALPTLKIKKAADLFAYNWEDFELVGYDPHPPIKGQVAV